VTAMFIFEVCKMVEKCKMRFRLISFKLEVLKLS